MRVCLRRISSLCSGSSPSPPVHSASARSSSAVGGAEDKWWGDSKTDRGEWCWCGERGSWCMPSETLTWRDREMRRPPLGRADAEGSRAVSGVEGGGVSDRTERSRNRTSSSSSRRLLTLSSSDFPSSKSLLVEVDADERASRDCWCREKGRREEGSEVVEKEVVGVGGGTIRTKSWFSDEEGEETRTRGS